MIANTKDSDLSHKDLCYKRMFTRMEENYNSKLYMLDQSVDEYRKNELVVNFNAVMPVLEVYCKVYREMAEVAGQVEAECR
jgi:hypothetical protein